MLGKKLRKSGSMLSPFPQKPKTLNNTEQNCGKCTITIPTINENVVMARSKMITSQHVRN